MGLSFQLNFPDVSILEVTKLAGLDTPVISSLSPGLFFPVSEMSGVSLALSSSCLSFSGLSSQFGTSISDAAPVRGTPSAIGALKFHRHAAISFHPAATLFQNPKSNSPQVIQHSDTTVVSDIKAVCQQGAPSY